MERLYYRRVLRSSWLGECSVSKGLALTTSEMLERKAVKKEVTRLSATQQPAIVRPKWRLRCYGGLVVRAYYTLKLAAVA